MRPREITMKYIGVLMTVLVLGGCSAIYADLEAAFGVEAVSDATPLATRTVSFNSQIRRGITTYRNLATIRVSTRGVEIEVDMFFVDPVHIPLDEVAGCGMICFGPGDERVTVMVPRTSTELMIPSSPALLDWCWSNRKPMFPSSVRHAWEDRKAVLPSAHEFSEQFADRAVFDQQTRASCRGR